MKYKLLSVLIIGILLLSITNAYTLTEIKTIASSPEPGDALLIWVGGGFWSPPYVDENNVTRQECTWPGLMVTRDDGTSIWIEPNFWNIVSGSGENYLRFINSSDKVAFYVKLENVTTQWGGIAWATPEVVFVGRAPPQFAQLPSAGGYEWFSLPMSVSEFLQNYDELYVKASYEVVKANGTLVRWGFILWFENPNGQALAEVYISFSDDFGGWVGDKTVLGTIAVPMIVDGELFSGEFVVMRALSGGGWAGMEFMLSNADLVNNTVIVDIKPFIEIVFNQLVNYFGVPADQVIWGSLNLGSYSGSEGTGFEFGWIIHDVRILSPEESPKIITVTVTQTQTTTKTVTDFMYVTVTSTTTQTETLTETSTTTLTTTKIETSTTISPTTVTEQVTDWTLTGVAGILLLIIGFGVGWMLKKPK